MSAREERHEGRTCSCEARTRQSHLSIPIHHPECNINASPTSQCNRSQSNVVPTCSQPTTCPKSNASRVHDVPRQCTQLLILNIQGLTPNSGSSTQWKLPYLQSIISQSNCYVPYVCITESWAQSFHTDAQLHIPDYIPHRSDRVDRSHGGVITYIHQNLSASSTEKFCNQFCEVVSVSIESEKL